MKKHFLSLLIFLFASNAGFAIKLEKLPFMSDFHIGIINGIGIGINLGASALLPFYNLGFGAEIEQLMTDVNYSATLNATRFGGLIRYALSDKMKINYHLGNFNFIPSRDFQYKDLSGQMQFITEAVNYKGSYWAVSLDYNEWDFIFSPKYVMDSIKDKGSVSEFDFNIGKSF